MSQPTTAKRTDDGEPIIIAGYVAAVLFPLLGFILGLTQINEHRDGLRIIFVSLFATLLYSAGFLFCVWFTAGR